jgi:hypothetical protein
MLLGRPMNGRIFGTRGALFHVRSLAVKHSLGSAVHLLSVALRTELGTYSGVWTSAFPTPRGMLLPHERTAPLSIRALWSAALFFLTALLIAPSPGSSGDVGASDSPASRQDSLGPTLEEQLKSFEREMDVAANDTIFASGRIPDLVVATSSDVHGEIEPCG